MAQEEKTKENTEDKPVKKRSMKKNLIWLSCLIIFIGIGVVASLSFWSSMALTIEIAQEPVNFQEKFEVSVDQTEPSMDTMSVPGEFFETEQDKWDVFPATGSDFDEGKARGIVIVYNNHTPASPVTLRMNTRFLSSENGKIFRCQEGITIPAAKQVDGELVPGELEVEVLADSAGEDYNIGPAEFSVPGLSGTALYYNVWAKSEEPMQGGFKQGVKKITDQDIEKAKDSLQLKIRELAKETLQKTLGADIVLNNDAIIEEHFESSCFKEAGEIAEEFNCEGKSTIKWFGFKISDVKEVAIEHILLNLPSSQSIREDTLEFDFSPTTILEDEAKMIMDVNMKVNSYTPLSQDVFLSRIVGLSQKEIRDVVFEKYQQISDIQFEFWPFWVDKAPKSRENITIQLNFAK